MATVTIRNLDDDVGRQLKARAAAHEHSMEADVRALLIASIAGDELAKSWLEATADLRGDDVPVPQRSEPRALPAGRRRDSRMHAIEVVLGTSQRVLPYDEPAAREYARLQELRRTTGIPLSTENGMVAAICSARNATLATRHTKDFVGLGIDLVDPWSVII